MKIRWNSYEPPVLVDLSFDPEGGSIIEVHNAEGQLCEVRKTQITGSRDRTEDINRVYIWVDGFLPSTEEAIGNPVKVDPNFLVEVRSADNAVLFPTALGVNGRAITIKVKS